MIRSKQLLLIVDLYIYLFTYFNFEIAMFNQKNRNFQFIVNIDFFFMSLLFSIFTIIS